MSDFDDAFALADESAFRVMSREQKAILYNLGVSAGTEVTVIEMPDERTSDYRVGGKVEDVEIEFEVSRAEFEAAHAETQWKLRVGDVDYRIKRTRSQGGTLTLVCGPLADTTADAWS